MGAITVSTRLFKRHSRGPSFLRHLIMNQRSSSTAASSSLDISNPPCSFLTEPIHILGAGSMGLLLAASIRIAVPNYPIQLLLRDNDRYRSLLEYDEEEGSSRKNKTLTVCLRRLSHPNDSSRSGPPRLVPVPAQIIRPPSSTSFANPQRPFRNLIITTKAFDAIPAVTSMRHRINESTKIIVLCNGSLAVMEQLRHAMNRWDVDEENDSQAGGREDLAFQAAANDQLHLAWTSHGAYRDALDSEDDELVHVVHAGHGQLAIENYPGLAQLLQRAGLGAKTCSSAEMLLQLWCKLAANCVINPLTAVHSCRNGALLDLVDIDETISLVTAEVARVAQTDGLDVTEASLADFVHQVIHDTANNKSSMLQDVLAGRQTEIDYLNGYIVQRAQALGVPCPANVRLCQQVAALSQKGQCSLRY